MMMKYKHSNLNTGATKRIKGRQIIIMSIPFLQTCNNKRKRRHKVFDFHTFPNSFNPTGPFRDNVRLFLQECAVPQDYPVVHGKPVWCTLLLHHNSTSAIPLYTEQENVGKLPSPFCDHGRFAGHYWSRPLDSTALDLTNLLLHGMIHAHGYGHLLTMNGIEGGSEFLSVRMIMDLWDRICTNLLVRYGH